MVSYLCTGKKGADKFTFVFSPQKLTSVEKEKEKEKEKKKKKKTRKPFEEKFPL